MRSSKLRNRPLIIFQCAGFAVLILCGAVRTLYQNGPAITGLGGAVGLCSSWKITGLAGSSSGGNQEILRRDSAGRQTIVRCMNGALLSDAAYQAILPPSWKMRDLGDLGLAGSRDILRMNSSAGKFAVLHAQILVPRDLDPIAARAPPLVAVKCCHRSRDASPYIDGEPISLHSLACQLFPGGAHCLLIFSSPFIRAPPMSTSHC